MPISSYEDFNKTKGIEILWSFLKNQPAHNLNICDATLSKNRYIISIGNDLGKLKESNSKRILFPFIPTK